MIEDWREIPGYEGRYMVSTEGRVRSLVSGHIMLQTVVQGGYTQVNLTKARGGQQRHQVHQLVLLAFKGPRPPGLVSRHLDGTPSNNRRSNLCYGTYKENQADREAHGTGQRGEKNASAKLSAEEVALIRKQYVRGDGVKLAREFGVSRSCITAIAQNKRWVN